MIRLVEVIRGTIAGVVVSGSFLLAAAPAHAQDSDTWQSVRKAGVLRCGAAVAPPNVMRDPATGAYTGIFSELCRDFGEKVLKVKVQFVDTTWDNIVAGLQSDKWDLAMALNDTPERRKAISFSGPVVPYDVTFAYNKNNPKLKNLQSIADFDKPDVTVTVMSGTAQDKAISAVLKQAKILRLPGEDEARLALMSRRADLQADEGDTNKLLVAAHPDWATSFQPKPALAQQQICFGVRQDLPAADLKVLNDYLAQQVKSGNVDRLTNVAIKTILAQSK